MNNNGSKRRRADGIPSSVVHYIVEGDTKVTTRHSSPTLEHKRLDAAENAAAKVKGMQRRSVSFGSLQVRHYDVEIGNNPSCRNGTPIQLSWNYTQAPLQCIETYEASRNEVQPRRKHKELILRRDQREIVLKNAGYTDLEIKQAEVINLSKFRNDVASFRCRTISDLSCSWTDTLDLQEKSRRISTSEMKNETWDTNVSASTSSFTPKLLQPNNSGKNSVTSTKYFQLKRPNTVNKNIIKGENLKKITVLPRKSYSSFSSSSTGSDKISEKKFPNTSPLTRSSSLQKVQKSTHGYQLVIMPRNSQQFMNKSA